MPANVLRRSRQNRILGGVSGGLAEWLGWDVTLVRIPFPGILVYLILWIVMLKEAA